MQAMVNRMEAVTAKFARFPARLAALAAATALAGCAGGMSAADCAAVDWRALGLADGKAGARPKLVEERAEDCRAHGVAFDAAAYQQGRADGLALYCSPEGGFTAGRSGGEYYGVCPTEREAAFLADYALGAKLFTLTAARDKAMADYEAAVSALDQHRYLKGVAEKRYLKPSISNEDRENERQDIAYRGREIARLDKDLPKLLSAIEASKAALETYEAELKAAGKSY